jgi:hypothetical protein
LKIAATFVFLTVCATAHAGVVMNMARKDIKSGEQMGTTSSYFQDEMTRTDSTRKGKKTTFIFREDRFYIVDHQKKQYIELDEQKLEQLTGQLNSAMKQMEETLAKLPPEQRQMVEKMMKGKMGQAGMSGDHTLRVQELGAGQFESYKCSRYAIYIGKDKTSELCAVPPETIEGLEESMESIHAMARLLAKLMQSVRSMPFAGAIDMSSMAALEKIHGIPVRTVHFKDGEAVIEEYLIDSEQKELEESLFSPPADYSKSDPFKKM